MAKFLLNLIFTILLNLFHNTVAINYNYTPFVPFQNETFIEINSIYGTGNRLKDISYKLACNSLCIEIDRKNLEKNSENFVDNKNYTITYDNSQCCTGKDLNKLQCMEKRYCEKLIGYIDGYFVIIVFSTYITLLCITMVIMFIIVYYLSIKNSTGNRNENEGTNTLNKKQCIKNGLVAALLTLLGGFIIPIIILKFICLYRNISMTKILGGDFRMISSTKLVMSLETKNLEKKIKYMILENQDNINPSIRGNNKEILSNEHIENNESGTRSINFDKNIDTSKKLNMKDDELDQRL
jgi:hypothetical protein